MAATGARVQVVKWGNSQAVRLPKNVLQQADVREGQELLVRVKRGRIELEPAPDEITLEKLVAAITPQNLHKPEDWGRPTGNEIW